jgi:hypothetical protein
LDDGAPAQIEGAGLDSGRQSFFLNMPDDDEHDVYAISR